MPRNCYRIALGIRTAEGMLHTTSVEAPNPNGNFRAVANRYGRGARIESKQIAPNPFKPRKSP